MSDAVDLNTSAVVYLTDGKNIKLMTKMRARVFTLFGDLSVNVLVLNLTSSH
jgi:K+-transporting ATPase c subunit